MSESTPAAKSPNALADMQSAEARAGVPTGLEPGQGYRLGRAPESGRKGASEPVQSKVGILVSVLLHALGVVFLFMSALLAPKRESVVPVFELVNLEKPKLRPLTPKTVKPPDPPPPEPEEVKPPEAPKLTPKPTKAVAPPKKKEPKVVKEPDPDPKPVKEVIPEQQVLPQVAAHVPSDPRLSMWAARVKKKAEMHWKPPGGIDILGAVTVKVNVKILRDGTIETAEIEDSSGSSELDQLALMAVKRMGSVVPIPDNWDGDAILARLDFPYNGH